MSESSTPRSSPSAFSAPLVVIVGVVIGAIAWMLPVNLKSVSPALLRAAGADTPTLGSFGRDLVDVEKIGPAELVLAAARETNDPRAPALASALEQFAARQPGLVAWGGWDPFLDPLFKLREDHGRHASTPVIAFLLPEKARDTLRGYLANSGQEGVQSILKLRELTATGQFVPAMRPGGQPLDVVILLSALLYQGEHLAPPLQRELRGLADLALQKKELGNLSAFYIDLLALGRRLDWAQLAELMRRTDSVKTVGEYAHLARVAPDQLPLIYSAALFSDSADQVATYLIDFGKVGLEDLKLALSDGQGAVKQLLSHQVPVNRSPNPSLGMAAELVLTHPQFMLALKYLGVLLGAWLVLRSLDRWLVGPAIDPLLPSALGHMKSGMLSLLFTGLLLIVTEPFLLRAAPTSEFQLRRPILVISQISAPAQSQPTARMDMDASHLITIAIFAALQIAVYFICLLKIRDIAAQSLTPLVKLRLMENEENLFDLGLYVGIAGTAVAMVLIALGITKANLIAAFSSNLFGITCVALVKIRHVRPYKRQLILEGQIEASVVREANEPSVSSGRSASAL